MPAYAELTNQVADRVVETTKPVQDATVKAVAETSKALGKVIPEVPALPLADRIPSVAEIVEANFAFAERILEAQKTYARSLLHAASPLAAKVQNGSKSQKQSKKQTTTTTKASDNA